MSKQGFTLVEVIIYVALLAIVLGFALLALFQLGDRGTANRYRTSVTSESDFVMQKIAWALAGAANVAEPAAGVTSSRLSVHKYGFSDNPVVIDLASGTVSLQRGSDPAVPLTTSNVKVDSLAFTHGTAALAAPEFVTIAMDMRASSSDPQVRTSTTLRTTIYLHQ